MYQYTIKILNIVLCDVQYIYCNVICKPAQSQLHRTCGFNNSHRSSHSKIPRHQYTYTLRLR